MMGRNFFVELWILKEVGLLLFHYKANGDLDVDDSTLMKEDLFAGFLSAITCFAREAMGKDLSAIKFKDKTLYQLRKHGMIACILVTNDAGYDERAVEQALEAILKSFVLMFPEDKSQKYVVTLDETTQEKFLIFVKKVLGITEVPDVKTMGWKAGSHHQVILDLLRDVENGAISHQEASGRIKKLYSDFESLDNQEKYEIAESLDELELVINQSPLSKDMKKRLKKIKHSLSLELRVKQWFDKF